MQVAIRELKSSLSRVLSIARSGETVEITSHRKPVARIVGIAPSPVSGLGMLVAQGAASWNGGKPVQAPTIVLNGNALPVSQMVLEDRR
jgi:prevent-host-death family protein